MRFDFITRDKSASCLKLHDPPPFLFGTLRTVLDCIPTYTYWSLCVRRHLFNSMKNRQGLIFCLIFYIPPYFRRVRGFSSLKKHNFMQLVDSLILSAAKKSFRDSVGTSWQSSGTQLIQVPE